MKKNKEGEQIITEAFEEHVKNNSLPFFRYEYFDLHHQCKNQKYENMNPLIVKLHPQNENFKFYVEDLSTNTV